MRKTSVVGAALLMAVAATAGPARASASADAAGFITHVSCDSFFAPSTAPRSRLNLGPAQAPLGRRSLGLVPSGAGSAAGPVVRFTSLASPGSTMAVHGAAGAVGVSYVWAVTADAPPGTAWHGRADVRLAGGWQQHDASSVTYEWHLVDLSTRELLTSAPAATPAAFALAHGDGSGYVVTGFGCDGADFNLDAVRAGDRTLDFEGIALTTAIEVSARELQPGQEIVVTGSVTDGSGRVTGDPLVLETRPPGGEWQAVEGPALSGPGGRTEVRTTLEASTELRWHRPESQYADEGWSEPVLVEVAAGP